jgi:hypothetical protein
MSPCVLAMAKIPLHNMHILWYKCSIVISKGAMFEGLNLALKYNENLRSQWWWAEVFCVCIGSDVVLVRNPRK